MSETSNVNGVTAIVSPHDSEDELLLGPPLKLAKQDPLYKSTVSQKPKVQQVFYSYADIHEKVSGVAQRIKNEFNPTIILAIGGGGFIPARMLRTSLKIPIVAVSLELYEDISGLKDQQYQQAEVSTVTNQSQSKNVQSTTIGNGDYDHSSESKSGSNSSKTVNNIGANDKLLQFGSQQTSKTTVVTTPSGSVRQVQWFDPTSLMGQRLKHGRVLIVDEVDDSRTTLEACVTMLKKTFQVNEQDSGSQQYPEKVGILVVHNKKKAKKGKLPEDVLYWCTEEVEDKWICYPWDAETYGHSIRDHEKKSVPNSSIMLRNDTVSITDNSSELVIEEKKISQ